MRQLLIFICIFLLSVSVFAQSGARHLKNGDMYFGGKLALGSVYGAGVGFVVGGEYGLQEGFLSSGKVASSLGIGATFGYSSYDEDFAFNNYSWEYTNIIILVNGYYHADLVNNDDVDTYLVVSLGYNGGSVDYSGPGTNFYNTPTHGGAIFGIGIGARYFFSPNIAAVGELGFGMGIFRLGIDYKI